MIACILGAGLDVHRTWPTVCYARSDMSGFSWIPSVKSCVASYAALMSPGCCQGTTIPNGLLARSGTSLSCSPVSHAQLPVLKAAKLGDAVGKVAANGDIQQARL